jgi:uncharacterized membrane protein
MSFFQKYRSVWYSIAFLCVLIAGRMIYTHTLQFSFLFWNLFLAIVPLYLSYRIHKGQKALGCTVTAFTWLLFFPNAAHLLTDIVHLRQSTHLIYWLDMIILYLAGIYGLFISMYSLREMEDWYGRYMPLNAKRLATFAILLLSGYGIYLGRVERWNSWDVVAQPIDLFTAMFHHSRHPFRNREVWAMSTVFGTGLLLLYYFFSGLLRKSINSD